MGVKVTFDPTVQRIYIHSGEIELDVKADLYSDAKEDWLNTEGFSKYEFPFEVIGGDPTVGAQYISPYFFMIEDWHLQPFEADHELTLIGNLFRQLGGSVAKPTSGEYTVSIDRITTITLVESGAGSLTTEEHNQLMSLPSQADIADGVWDEQLSGHTDVGSAGEALSDAGGGASPSAIADAVWDEPRADHVVAGTFGRSLQIGHDGQAQAGASKSITLATTASSVNNFYIDDLVLITGGQGVGQARRIKSYVGGTRVASIHTAWSTVPNNTSTYIILPGGKSAAADTPQTVVITTIATLASQIQFTLTEGSPDDNAYNGFRCVIVDSANSLQVCLGYVSDYVGSTRTVYLREDPAIYTYGVGDMVMILLDATNEATIADAVWDEQLSGHVTAGSSGKVLGDVTSLPTLAEIEASTVLAKQAELLRALGLMQENYALDQTVWDDYQGQKLMTSGRLRIYSNAGSVGTGNDVLATYLITANWTDNELDDYSVVKQ